MFCKKCGKEIIEGNKFCIFCGTKILSDETVEMENSPVEVMETKVETNVATITEDDFEEKLLDAFILGKKAIKNSNYQYYRDVFKDIKNGKTLEFNPMTFLLSGFQLLYRKNWIPLLILVVTSVLFSIIAYSAGGEVGGAAAIFLGTLASIFSDKFLYKRYLKIKKELISLYGDDIEKILSQMRLKGGTLF